jgi:glycosyltransferase involved in cell wall biosynthesis
MTASIPSRLASVTESYRLEGGRRLRGTNAPNPVLTVLTVVFNGGDQLASTMESVLALRRADIEYIVIDGGSTDSTVDLLRRYEDRLDYWLSEPDQGIYDAMNKGIARARGVFVIHLNIGDQLLGVPLMLNEALPCDIACIAGRVRTGSDTVHIPSASRALKMHNTLHHQGCFYRRGPALRYDLRYRVFSDFDLNQRLVKAGYRIQICNDVVAVHDQGGISHTTRRFNEVFQIICKNEGLAWMCLSFLYFKWRGLQRRLFGT